MARPDDNHYVTPPAFTRALLAAERFDDPIWEPCAGTGEMAEVMRRAGHDVFASTIGDGYISHHHPDRAVIGGCDVRAEAGARHPNLVTNPPYSRKINDFVRHLLGLQGLKKIALLVDVKFLTSVGRWRLFAECPPTRCRLYSDRLPMFPPGELQCEIRLWRTGERGRPTTTQNYAWVIWEMPTHPGSNPVVHFDLVRPHVRPDDPEWPLLSLTEQARQEAA